MDKRSNSCFQTPYKNGTTDRSRNNFSTIDSLGLEKQVFGFKRLSFNHHDRLVVGHTTTQTTTNNRFKSSLDNSQSNGSLFSPRDNSEQKQKALPTIDNLQKGNSRHQPGVTVRHSGQILQNQTFQHERSQNQLNIQFSPDRSRPEELLKNPPESLNVKVQDYERMCGHISNFGSTYNFTKQTGYFPRQLDRMTRIQYTDQVSVRELRAYVSKQLFEERKKQEKASKLKRERLKSSKFTIMFPQNHRNNIIESQYSLGIGSMGLTSRMSGQNQSHQSSERIELSHTILNKVSLRMLERGMPRKGYPSLSPLKQFNANSSSNAGLTTDTGISESNNQMIQMQSGFNSGQRSNAMLLEEKE